MICFYKFTFFMGILCYFIGFFFGRVTKKYSKKKIEKCETYDDVIKREG